MQTIALPDKFSLTFNPKPEEPSELREWAMFVVGVIVGMLIATLFPFRF